MSAVTAAEKIFTDKARQIPSGVTPGFVLQAYHKGKKFLDVEWGKTYKYYDLASLTKIFFTVPWMMKASEAGLVDVQAPLEKFLPWSGQKAAIKSILSHSAGNEWWRPYYKNLSLEASREFKKNQLRELLRQSVPHKHSEKAVYSDVDFFLLGFLLENVLEQSWDRLWNEFQSEALQHDEIFFHSENKPLHTKSHYAPTEQSAWQKRLLQGEVHDENAWALGGVAPHAGLFGSVAGVAQWGLWLRNVYLGKNNWLRAKTLRTFSQRAMPAAKGDWGMGFMLPTEGSASCGKYFSLKSFGHTGFTGTSFWFDPEKDVFVVLLSNRIHPTRSNEQFRQWRPRIHDWVMDIVEKKDLR